MAVKIVCTYLAIIFTFISSTCYSDSWDTDKNKPYSPIEYLKNYALSVCIAHGYQAKEVVNDATAAARGYKELGSFGIDAYNEAATLDAKFLARKYIDVDGKEKLTLMKCIDYYHSKELDALVKKHEKIESDLVKKYAK